MLPHVVGRIVSMQRFPDGIDGEQFFQKNVPDYFPEWIRTVEVDKEGGTLRQALIEDGATLVYLASQACITPHCWLSRVENRDRPDRMTFDLDPSGTAGFDEVRQAARLVRELLVSLELVPFVMTTGSRGVHVVAPLEPRSGFDRVRAVARGLAGRLAGRHPELLTAEQRKAKRGDRVFLDYLRNGYAQTTVAPYSVRARPGAPEATPIDWDELSRVGPRIHDLRNLFRRLGQKNDPWSGIERRAGTLEAAETWLDASRT
jgi:bifunctional non-homologous end joining protein LigD